jgi:F-type H+-transporting ATPase subunit delta
MAQENIAIARPYAKAVLGRAKETDTLDLWSDMLGLLSALVQSKAVTNLITSPKLASEQIQAALLEIGGEHLNEEGQNLLKILVRSRRLFVLPEISTLYEQLKRELRGILKVQVSSAHTLDATQEQALAEALKKRLQRDIEIQSTQDPDLIGGVVIHAGDLVIDGSVRGQLQRMANQLRF